MHGRRLTASRNRRGREVAQLDADQDEAPTVIESVADGRMDEGAMGEWLARRVT
jgi:hypothetical protein